MAVAFGKPASQLQREWSVEEFWELKVFCERIEPFGDPWRQTGILAALLHNAWYKGKTTEADWMPCPKPRPPVADVAAKIMSFFKGK